MPTDSTHFTDNTSTDVGGGRRVPLSVLDLVPRSLGMTPSRAIEESVKLAEEADELGYGRFWMAEHHGSETFMSSATALLLGHMAQHTSRIRLGSGGVMLPNHAPLMVAEYYGTLATIYGDRFDLGLGRAPGTDPMTAAALARSSGQLNDFASQVASLQSYLGDPVAGARVRALPGESTHIPIWMLGSSTGGAQVAAALGLPFSFASHFAPDQLEAALSIYRARFNPDAQTAQVERPTTMAGVNVLVAPTQEEADFLFTSAQLMAIRIRSGQPAPLDPPVSDLAAAVPAELMHLAHAHQAARAVGTPEVVVERLESFAAEHQLDELIVTTYTYDPQLRRRSYRMLAEAWGLS
ncbi:MAG: LLM class flavin-dependent oxidoreductase [Ornithinimicrobium sp.]|uniref:LLM class flavin-dependent oxidoreductase n=1 Tax=Ornithinimicrobium sp. TaxID=1977084 RepID=UPI0026DF9378|nr:LLM class flavin-dependent oxidoreductase [Ornithinimicrobium sp.]MDO5741108.1 LLM class flavin-dependent oxidoreductase [Ornithinimicrobium sp.]